MGNFNRGGGGGGFGGGSRGGGGGHFGGGNRGGGGFRREERGPVTMTKVTCDECKKSCEVPFRPTAGKPVYCNDCFRGQSAGAQDRPRRDFGGDRPQAPRPSFTVGAEGGSDTTKKQLELLNSKMDKLIASIENLSHSQPKAAAKVEVAKTMIVGAPKKEVKVAAKKVVKKAGKK